MRRHSYNLMPENFLLKSLICILLKTIITEYLQRNFRKKNLRKTEIISLALPFQSYKKLREPFTTHNCRECHTKTRTNRSSCRFNCRQRNNVCKEAVCIKVGGILIMSHKGTFNQNEYFREMTSYNF